MVNIESVWLGRPLARTTRTASATISPTPSGVTEKAMSMTKEASPPGSGQVGGYGLTFWP